MKTTTMILGTTLAMLAAAPAAFAQEATYEYPQPIASTATRAQVQAELAQARRDGSMRVWSTTYNHLAAARSLRTRDEVRGEVLAERRAPVGASAWYGEDSGSFAMRRPAGARNAGLTLAAAR